MDVLDNYDIVIDEVGANSLTTIVTSCITYIQYNLNNPDVLGLRESTQNIPILKYANIINNQLDVMP